MHIPDGYLSPSTCAVLYAASAPFWWTALHRVKDHLHTRMVPLLSACAAFSFVVMMFNLPLPGGTTGHAVGMGLASIIVGPWASILAISIALTIQAVFFGDGGITAIGANCFNMAIVGSLASYCLYRIVGYRAPVTSARRVLAAGLGGYVGINLAALCAAIEFGVQPLWFHDASGAPLFAPYPLRISIPAMMLGHLTFAGLAEFVVSAGVLRYLQAADPALLASTAPDAAPGNPLLSPPSEAAFAPTTRKLWAGLALLLILTPLGILAVGSAWGEWTAQDFADPKVRSQIALASGNQAPPEQVPRGLQRLSTFWTAPLSSYAPSFIRSAGFGYFVSAAVGVGLIVLLGMLAGWALPKIRSSRAARPPRRNTFVEKTIAGFLDAARYSLSAEEIAGAHGLLQPIDARVKLIGIFALIVATVSVRNIWMLLGLLALASAIALACRIPIKMLLGRIWIAVLAFSGLIALPAVFLTPGRAVFELPGLGWTGTAQGVRSALLLVLRTETTATWGLLLVVTTLWPHLLKALRSFRIPVIAVVILGMTYRFIFLLLQIANDMFESRKARLVGELEPADRRRLASATAGVLLGKTLQMSADVHTAMLARGFRGEVHLLNEPRMQTWDWLRLCTFLSVALLAVWLGR